MNLEALKNVKLAEVEEVKGSSKISIKTPEKGDILITNTGKIFYSEKLEKLVGTGGIDFTDSRNWLMYKKLGNDLPEVIFFSTVKDPSNPKLGAKTDVKKQSTNAPIVFVKRDLIPLLIEMYKVDKDFHYVELQIEWDYPLTNASGIYSLPKTVSSGDQKGEVKYVRRESTTFYPISIIHNDTTTDVEETINIENTEDENIEQILDNE